MYDYIQNKCIIYIHDYIIDDHDLLTFNLVEYTLLFLIKHNEILCEVKYVVFNFTISGK